MWGSLRLCLYDPITKPHACAAAAARAAAKAMRGYSLTHAINHGLTFNAANTPPVVATPALHTHETNHH